MEREKKALMKGKPHTSPIKSSKTSKDVHEEGTFMDQCGSWKIMEDTEGRKEETTKDINWY